MKTIIPVGPVWGFTAGTCFAAAFKPDLLAWQGILFGFCFVMSAFQAAYWEWKHRQEAFHAGVQHGLDEAGRIITQANDYRLRTLLAGIADRHTEKELRT